MSINLNSCPVCSSESLTTYGNLEVSKFSRGIRCNACKSELYWTEKDKKFHQVRIRFWWNNRAVTYGNHCPLCRALLKREEVDTPVCSSCGFKLNKHWWAIRTTDAGLAQGNSKPYYPVRVTKAEVEEIAKSVCLEILTEVAIEQEASGYALTALKRVLQNHGISL